jgi:hypothetical protein
MDIERHVISEGRHGGGLSWLVWAQRQPFGGAEPGADELMSMIRVISADGRVLHEGGGAGPALYPGDLMNVSTGGSDEGPHCLLTRVHPSIRWMPAYRVPRKSSTRRVRSAVASGS